MLIGVPKEIKTNENRIALVPAGAEALTAAGHSVVIEKGGGLGSGLPRLTVGWVPQRLVFAARGQGPFQLAYGSVKMQPAAYPVETVVPGWRSDQQPTLARGELLPERLLGGTAALRIVTNYKVWGLWAALSVGVLLLAWMTWGLARQMRSTPAADANRTGSKS